MRKEKLEARRVERQLSHKVASLQAMLQRSYAKPSVLPLKKLLKLCPPKIRGSPWAP